ncbi:MAG TPA: hypothetical protein VEA40_12415 [Ramlibacter sp.]|nr:hypothetical protein [Ramlibacter sp.]
MPVEIYDPTLEVKAARLAYAPRPASLQGLTIGLVDNTKFNADQLLLRVAGILEREHGAKGHLIRRKKNAAVPAHAELIAEYQAQCQVVVAGIGD